MLLPETAAQYAAEARKDLDASAQPGCPEMGWHVNRALVFALLTIAAQLNPAVPYEPEEEE
jgi:hypothetical protein